VCPACKARACNAPGRVAVTIGGNCEGIDVMAVRPSAAPRGARCSSSAADSGHHREPSGYLTTPPAQVADEQRYSRSVGPDISIFLGGRLAAKGHPEEIERIGPRRAEHALFFKA